MSSLNLPFVFLDGNNRPYMVHSVGPNKVWISYWHPNNQWVTLRPISGLTEIWAMEKKRLPDDQARLYDGFEIAVANEAALAAEKGNNDGR